MAEITASVDEACNLCEILPDTNFENGRETARFWSGRETKELSNEVCWMTDFSAEVPSDATITAAEARFYIYDRVYSTGCEPENYMWDLRRCRRNGLGANTDWLPDEATFNSYETGSSWGTAGGYNTTSDIDTTGGASKAGPTTTGWSWTWDVTTMVQDAHASRSQILDVILHSQGELVGVNDISYLKIDLGYNLVITYTAAGAAASRNQGYVLGSRLGLPSLPEGWLRRRGLLVPVGA